MSSGISHRGFPASVIVTRRRSFVSKLEFRRCQNQEAVNDINEENVGLPGSEGEERDVGPEDRGLIDELKNRGQGFPGGVVGD